VTVSDLRALPARQIAAVVECAGNGRSFLPPPWEGNAFTYGAVGNASWTGASLADVLGPSHVKDGTREIVFVGADRGFEKNVGREIGFERSLPLDVALHPDTLLAYEMNGEPLPIEHGYPVRLIVPGWFGVASVKWLTEVRAQAEPFNGYFQVDRYILPSGNDPPRPLRERGVRAVVTWPVDGATVPAGAVEVRGLAWSGNQPVVRVELSVDGGATWQAAELDAPESAYAWQHWRTTWNAPPRAHTLKVRATDERGRTQPDAAEWNLLGYANNGIQSVSVVAVA
jgi:DMSO/TMAO reductase YedYZ molybdopterin-dependent catalytic subunit